jgi:hypothetical protein
MRGDFSSVPRLGGSVPPEVDLSGRSYAVVAIGAAACPVAEGWTRRIASSGAPVWFVQVDGLDEALVGVFEEQLRVATVGWRLMLAGPEADVMRLRAPAIQAGALPVEIREHVTAVDRRRVRCAHCRTIMEAEVGIGGSVVCGGCALTLSCHGHFSRRHAAYLGSEAT